MILKNVKVLTKNSKLIIRCFNTELPPELKTLQEICQRFSNDELKPIARKLDKEFKFPKEQIKVNQQRVYQTDEQLDLIQMKWI